ncbi:MAG TPA: prolyl oligopeptidase family serine peptidase [Candidatus Eisenbacteria bacterium]|jgi:prolyl oligopeptidase
MPRIMRIPARLVLAAAALLAVHPLATAAPQVPKPPATRVESVKEVLHGVEIVDPYRWLEDKDSPETRTWIDAQNRFTDSLIAAQPGREAIRARLGQLLKVDQVTVPYERGGRYFFTKRTVDQDLSVLCMRRGPTGADEVLVDPHPLSPDHTVSVSILDVSDDGKLLAYGTRKGGEDEVTVTLLDLETMKELPDRLPRARYFNLSLKPDRTGFYYSRYGDEGSRILYHRLGTDPAADPVIFGEGTGRDKIIVSSLSDDGRHLVISVYYGSATDRSEVYFQDVAVGGPVTPIVNDVAAYFEPEIGGDHVYLQTNWNAPRNRILDVDLAHPARDAWREVVPEGDAVIESFSLAGGRILVDALKDVVSSLRVYRPDGTLERTLAFPTLGSVADVRGRWAGDDAYFSFSSFAVPSTIYRYAIADGGQSVWWKPGVPIASDPIEVRQVWYASKDGTKVPMFVVHKKGLKLTGAHPTLLTGYGGFTLSQTPVYSPLAALWVERGGVYALPGLRGGGEFGEAWHQAGKLEKKQNVFDDFSAAADWLVKNRYTGAGRLSIRGGSNGGLLVGAALTQHPEKFGAVVCNVPLLDMLRYHKFLVARFWVPEYGSSEDPEQFKFLLAYSPYQHVVRGTRYPAVLLVSGDSDTRVDPLHARKMTALLQASTGSGRPVLLHYDTRLGHAGGKPVSKQIDDLSVELTFLFWQLGVNAAAPQALSETR